MGQRRVEWKPSIMLFIRDGLPSTLSLSGLMLRSVIRCRSTYRTSDQVIQFGRRGGRIALFGLYVYKSWLHILDESLSQFAVILTVLGLSVASWLDVCFT